MAGCTEDIKILQLVIFHDHLGNLRRGACPYDGCKAGRGAVHKFNPSFSQNNIVGRSQPDFSALYVRIFMGMVKIRIRNTADPFSKFVGEYRRHTGIQKGTQIRQMIDPLDMGREQPASKLHWFLHIFQGFNLVTQK